MNVTKSQASGKGLTMDFKADKNLPKFIQIDNTRLNQVLINIISNAIKFTESGSVDVTIDYVAKNPTDQEVLQTLDCGVTNKACILSATELMIRDSFHNDDEDLLELEEDLDICFIDRYNKPVKNESIQTETSFASEPF